MPRRFKDEVDDLRRALLAAVQEHVAPFTQRTGATPTNIRIVMVDTSTMGSPRQYAISGVELEFKI